MNLELTGEEVVALREALLELAEQMDDDGREGAFDATPLRAIYNKLKALAGAVRAAGLQPSFRTLDEAETVAFRQWARQNHKPFESVNEVWHPVVRDECAKIDREAELKMEPR